MALINIFIAFVIALAALAAATIIVKLSYKIFNRSLDHVGRRRVIGRPY